MKECKLPGGDFNLPENKASSRQLGWFDIKGNKMNDIDEEKNDIGIERVIIDEITRSKINSNK